GARVSRQIPRSPRGGTARGGWRGTPARRSPAATSQSSRNCTMSWSSCSASLAASLLPVPTCTRVRRREPPVPPPPPSPRPRPPLGCPAVNPRTDRPHRPPRAARAARKTRRAASAPPGTIVVALGGNAVAPPNERPTISNQFRHTRASRAPIVDLARDGWRIALVHGNGPQVGDDLARNELAADQVEPLPLGVLVAATAGWMGYMIQQSLQNALARAGIARQVVTLVTQTLCDANDPNLRQPTKPIGHALDPARVARLQARG